MPDLQLDTCNIVFVSFCHHECPRGWKHPSELTASFSSLRHGHLLRPNPASKLSSIPDRQTRHYSLLDVVDSRFINRTAFTPCRGVRSVNQYLFGFRSSAEQLHEFGKLRNFYEEKFPIQPVRSCPNVSIL